jgi:hypothetical protein
MTGPREVRSAVCLLVFTLRLLSAPVVCAQDTELIDKAIHARWAVILSEVARFHDVPLEGGTLKATPAKRRVIYREALLRLSNDPELLQLAVADVLLVAEATPVNERQYIDQLREAKAEHTQTKSLSATSTNPAAGNIAERSGFTELLALALNGQNFFSTDATAVSLSLSALALFSLADPDVYSELHRYQQHSLLRRIGGTVVFGTKVPEKEITGISGLPVPDTLLDVFMWDVKIRVLGDKDPRARRWYHDMLGRQGILNQLAVVQADVPIEDALVVTEELNYLRGKQLASLKERINRSPQVTFKASGTHLTKETGKNKYTVGLLFDKGLGPNIGVTTNLLYSVTDDLRLGAGRLFQVRQFAINASLTSKFARDAIVTARTVDWTNGGTSTIFKNKSSLPIDAQNTWKLFSNVEIPITDAASIPLSIVYTNDANELQKTQYVAGFVGITYDFSAVPKLFRKP